MRWFMIVALAALLAWPRPAPAQPTPVVVPTIEVRSGPSLEYNPTSELRQGDQVVVLHESKDQLGWLAIKPPIGSYSWIEAKHVNQLDMHTGYVLGDNGNPVPLLPGSTVYKQKPNAESAKVPPGSQVTILSGAPQKAEDGETWLMISPWPTEKRWIPANAVRWQSNSGGNAPSGFAAANPYILQADQALQAGNIEQAKTLYQQAAERTQDNAQKSYCYGKLQALWQQQPSWNTPGAVNAMPATQTVTPGGTPGKLVSYNTSPQTITGPARWSQWGILRNSVYTPDGTPTYVLESKTGQPLMYVTTPPGLTLRDFVGRMVCLYGTTAINNSDPSRPPLMTATQMSLAP